MAEMVARRINSYGVKVKRSAKQVLNKIYYWEKSFRTAHDFANSETGAGLLATDNVVTFDKLIEKRCQYYEDLLPIFQGRASARARITNSNLDDDDFDEDASEHNDETTTLFIKHGEKKATNILSLQLFY
jgi:hypothetical protein